MNDLSRDEAIEILQTQNVAHIGVLSDGEPYVTPLSFVILGDELCFRSVAGRRLSAVKDHPRVCIEASAGDDSTWQSVVAWGDAYVVDDPNRQGEVIAAILSKYSRSIDSMLSFSASGAVSEEGAVVAVPLTDISGRSSGHDLGPTIRPGRL